MKGKVTWTPEFPRAALAGGVVLSEREMDMLAWEFLGSEFAKLRGKLRP